MDTPTPPAGWREKLHALADLAAALAERVAAVGASVVIEVEDGPPLVLAAASLSPDFISSLGREES